MNEAESAKSWVIGSNQRGESIALLFTPTGVVWKRGQETESLIRRMPPQPAPSSQQGRAGSEAPSGLGGINSTFAFGAPDAIGLASQVIGCITDILQWWEARQQRMMDEARFEEDRRIPWTYDMIQRWVVAHKDGAHLDLDISYYLAREAMATLRAIAATPKMAVPQAMLYDLDQIRKTMASMRSLLGRQCDLLATLPMPGTPDFVMVGQDLNVPSPNFELIRRLSADPAPLWDQAVDNQNAKDFDAELKELMRRPDKLYGKLLGPETADLNRISELAVTLTRSTALRTAAAIGQVGSLLVPGAGLVTAAPLWYAEFQNWQHAKEVLRRDEFRELILFSAEVARVRVLHQIWNILDGLYSQNLGSGFLVSEQDGILCLAAAPEPGSELQVIASAARQLPALSVKA